MQKLTNSVHAILSSRIMKSARHKILIIVDAPNWSHDFKTRSLQRSLGGKYEILKRFQSEVSEADLKNADLILVYYWLQFNQMKHLEDAFMRNRSKLLVGVCSHFELEGELRASALSTLRKMARGVFANNLRLHKELQSLLDVPLFYTPNGVTTDFYRPLINSIPAERSNFFPGSDRFQAKLKVGPSRVGSLIKNVSNIGARYAMTNTRLRVGWAGSLSNQGPQQRGFYDLIVPAVSSVNQVQLVVAAREEKWRSPKEMLEFYRSIDVYLCASRSEGTPNPCLEAAASGVSLLTTRVGNMPELIQDGVNGLFIERNISDIATKLRQLRDNPTLRTELNESMLLSIPAWDWESQAGNYQNMFDTMLNI